MNASAPYGYQRVYVQDGAKKRPRLELNPPHDAVVRRIFDLTLQGRTSLDILKTFNSEGIPSPKGKAVAQDHRPQAAHQRSLHRHPSLGSEGPGRPGAGAGGGCLSRHRVNRRVRPGQKADGGTGTQGHPPPAAPPAPTCSAAWPSARPAARPSPPPKPRAASTPTTSASPCSSRAAGPAIPPGSTPRTSRRSSSPTSGTTSSPSPTSETW